MRQTQFVRDADTNGVKLSRAIHGTLRCLCRPSPAWAAGFSRRLQPPDHDDPILLGAPKGRQNKGLGGRRECSVAPSGLPGGVGRLIRRLKPPAKSWRPFGTKKRLNFTPFDADTLFHTRVLAGADAGALGERRIRRKRLEEREARLEVLDGLRRGDVDQARKLQ